MKDWHKFYWKWHVELGLIAVFCGLVIVGAVTFTTRNDVTRDARRGQQAYVAVCQYRSDLANRAQQGRDFLHLSTAQRIKKYGEAFGSLPSAPIRAAVLNEERAVQSLAALQC